MNIHLWSHLLRRAAMENKDREKKQKKRETVEEVDQQKCCDAYSSRHNIRLERHTHMKMCVSGSPRASTDSATRNDQFKQNEHQQRTTHTRTHITQIIIHRAAYA